MSEDTPKRSDEPERAGGIPGDADAIVGALVGKRVPNLVALYRFGSSASDALRRDSDLDYAVVAEERLDPVARFDLQEDLAGLLRRSVDLVDLRAASTVMRMQVISRGLAVDVRDPAAADLRASATGPR